MLFLTIVIIFGNELFFQPDRPDELARIKSSGGRVIYMNGARVEGVLGIFRAIGNLLFTILLDILWLMCYILIICFI